MNLIKENLKLPITVLVAFFLVSTIIPVVSAINVNKEIDENISEKTTICNDPKTIKIGKLIIDDGEPSIELYHGKTIIKKLEENIVYNFAVDWELDEGSTWKEKWLFKIYNDGTRFEGQKHIDEKVIKDKGGPLPWQYHSDDQSSNETGEILFITSLAKNIMTDGLSIRLVAKYYVTHDPTWHDDPDLKEWTKENVEIKVILPPPKPQKPGPSQNPIEEDKDLKISVYGKFHVGDEKYDITLEYGDGLSETKTAYNHIYTSDYNVHFRHTYSNPGKYTLRAKAKNSAGLASEYSETILTVNKKKSVEFNGKNIYNSLFNEDRGFIPFLLKFLSNFK